MSKLFAVTVSMALIATVAVSPLWAVVDKVRSDKAAGPAGGTRGGNGQASRGTPVGESARLLSVQEDLAGKMNPPGTPASLTDRDVYLVLADK